MEELRTVNPLVVGSSPTLGAMSKIDGFPDVVYINIDSHVNKSSFMENKFKEFKIINYKRFSAITPHVSNHPMLNPKECGCILSHLNIIFNFYKNSKDDLMIIMEDDVDISTIKNWDFSWKELVGSIPEFEILQLLRNQEEDYQKYSKLKEWDWRDKSTAAYLITKDYAKKIINKCHDLNRALYNLPNLSDEKEWPWPHFVGPVADYALYKDFKALSTCIFQQTHSLDGVWSTTSPDEEPEWYRNQHNQILEYWSKPHGLDDII